MGAGGWGVRPKASQDMTSRIAERFQRLRQQRRCGLFPYLMAGFPDVKTSEQLALAALEAGADGFEIGVPFSDPLADGTTLQKANAHALAQGASLQTAFDLAQFIRSQSEHTPVVLMSYYNPVRQRGDEAFAQELTKAQADGAIVPDLPAEEAGSLHAALSKNDLGLVPLLAPTSPANRIQAVAVMQPKFIYCVALVGVTGARQDLSVTLGDFLERVRTATEAPLVVGFGISRPEHVRRVADLGADGVIVASALADLIDHADDPVQAAREYLAELKNAASSPASAAS
jgi:tryptophan synthase alpha chain